MMYDDLFLHKLFNARHQTKYAKVTALGFNDAPIGTYEGRVTSGSINVDGTSAVRRTCQLTLVTDEVDLSDYLWGLDTKIRLEIGLSNSINSNYPEIIWFPQGVYIITSFSAALSTTGYTINLSGKDKMCMLNGENGGSLAMEVDFGQFEQEDAKGNITITKYPLKDIIREAVHHYGGEPYHNIIINDLDDRGLELQEYKYDIPMYLIRKAGASQYFQGTLNDIDVYINGSRTKISQLPQYDQMTAGAENDKSTKFRLSGNENDELYQATKIVYGQTAGYTPTEMTYTGELVARAGESITSVLDKIKNMLGNFEYFYDVDGRFIFQEQKNYINTAFTPIQKDGRVSLVNDTLEKTIFSFYDGELFSAINNTPNIGNLKNDFAVWGTRKNVAGKEIPIHARYAIDDKPLIYTSVAVKDSELKDYNKQYNFDLQGQTSTVYTTGTQAEAEATVAGYNNQVLTINNATYSAGSKSIALNNNIIKYTDNHKKVEFPIIAVDWRELIYQMARDYNKYGHLDSFIPKLLQANPTMPGTGQTGYEQYYTDIEGFWRQLYQLEPENLYDKVGYPTDEEKGNYYIKQGDKYIKLPSDQALSQEETYYKKNTDYYDNKSDSRYRWAKNVYEAPHQLNFWLDFLDFNGELSKFSVKAIGARPKVSNDKDVRAIEYLNVPEVVYSDDPNDASNDANYVRLNWSPKFKNMFSQSTQGKSAKEAIDELIYNHAYCTESVSLTSIPVYSLSPNRRVYIEDKDNGIEGEYIVSKYTIPLNYNGTMNITAIKAVDRII